MGLQADAPCFIADFVSMFMNLFHVCKFHNLFSEQKGIVYIFFDVLQCQPLNKSAGIKATKVKTSIKLEKNVSGKNLSMLALNT